MRYRVEWDGSALCLETDEVELARELGRFLNLPFEPTHASIDPTARVTRERTGFRVATPLGELRAGSWNDLLYLLLEWIAGGFREKCRRLVAHAGAFEAPSGWVVYFGAPRAGKSSLSFAAWRRGLRVVGDDRIVISPEMDTIEAFPKCMKLRLPKDAPHAVADQGLPEEIGIVGAIGDDRRFIVARASSRIVGYGEALPIGALVYLERNDGAETQISTCPAVGELAKLLPHLLPARFNPMTAVRLIKAYVTKGKLLKLTVGRGDIEAAVDLLCEL